MVGIYGKTTNRTQHPLIMSVGNLRVNHVLQCISRSLQERALFNRSLKFCLYLTSVASNQNLTMSLRNGIIRFLVLGFRSDIRIELQAPVIIQTNRVFNQNAVEGSELEIEFCFSCYRFKGITFLRTYLYIFQQELLLKIPSS